MRRARLRTTLKISPSQYESNWKLTNRHQFRNINIDSISRYSAALTIWVLLAFILEDVKVAYEETGVLCEIRSQ